MRKHALNFWKNRRETVIYGMHVGGTLVKMECKINILNSCNGIHNYATIDVERLEDADMELLTEVVRVVKTYNDLNVERA